jgi:hypothetical protein
MGRNCDVELGLVDRADTARFLLGDELIQPARFDGF